MCLAIAKQLSIIILSLTHNRMNSVALMWVLLVQQH